MPVISYYDGSGQLKLAHCNDIACAKGAAVTIVDPSSGINPTLVSIGANGFPVIMYVGGARACGDLTCTTSTLLSNPLWGYQGRYFSTAIGVDGLPITAVQRVGINGGLDVAHCNNLACSSAIVTSVDSGDVGEFPSIAIGTDGLPVIVYVSFTVSPASLKVAHCTNIACTTSTVATVDTVTVDSLVSLAIGSDGMPVISYSDAGALKVAHCSNATCTGATMTIADGGASQVSSITIGTDGMPLIAYHDYANQDLKVAHCASPFCVPNLRRR